MAKTYSIASEAAGYLFVSENTTKSVWLPDVFLKEVFGQDAGIGQADGIASVAGFGTGIHSGAGAADGVASVNGIYLPPGATFANADGIASVAGAYIAPTTAFALADGIADVVGHARVITGGSAAMIAGI